MKKRLLDLLQGIFEDMEAHSYNNYKDNDEIPLYLTVEQLRWLFDTLNELPN